MCESGHFESESVSEPTVPVSNTNPHESESGSQSSIKAQYCILSILAPLELAFLQSSQKCFESGFEPEFELEFRIRIRTSLVLRYIWDWLNLWCYFYSAFSLCVGVSWPQILYECGFLIPITNSHKVSMHRVYFNYHYKSVDSPQN